MYVGCYDAAVGELSTYRLRLEELCRLGFESVGLAIDWEEHPRDLSPEDRAAIAQVLRAHGAQLRLHPDLGKLQQRAVREEADLLVSARQEMEPVIAWAMELDVIAICCDSIRASLDETVAVFRLLMEMTAGTELKFGVENSQRGVINSPEKMNEAVERVGDERMGVLVDVGHINTTIANGWNACTSSRAFVEALRVPIWDTHIHNNDGDTDGHLTLRDPAGTLDLAEVVEGLRCLGYAGPLNMECAPKEKRLSLQEMGRTLVDDRRYLEGLIAGRP